MACSLTITETPHESGTIELWHGTPSTKLLPQDAVFFLRVVNYVLLVLVHPAGKRCQQDMPGTQVVEHPAILRRSSFCTLRVVDGSVPAPGAVVLPWATTGATEPEASGCTGVNPVDMEGQLWQSAGRLN